MTAVYLPEYLKTLEIGTLIDRETLLTFVKRRGRDLTHVPAQLRDSEMCFEAIKSELVALDFIPKEAFTDEIVDYVLTWEPMCLSVIPKKFLTYERCMKAIKDTNGDALEYIPDENQTIDICFEAVFLESKNRPSHLLKNVRMIANKFRTLEFYKQLYREVQLDIEEFPEALRSNIIN